MHPACFQRARGWLARRKPQQPSDWFTILALILITGLTDWLLLKHGLFSHLFDFGSEALNAVQAWVNHGFVSMLGFFPWGKGYLSADVPPDQLYQSKTPLHLFPLWGAYRLLGSTGFPVFKLVYSLLLASLNGLLLAGLARLCFPLGGHNWRSPIPGSLVFLCTYAITIGNEAMLRFCMIDEPDYMGLTLWLATVLALGSWVGEPGVEVGDSASSSSRGHPRLAMVLGFLASWSYPVLGALNGLLLALLQLLPLSAHLRKGLLSLIPGALLGVLLYWFQRIAANLLIPKKLYGSKLLYRMGWTPSLDHHDGVFGAFNFIFDQRSGGLSDRLRDSQIYHEHTAIWLIGLVLFVVVLARLPGVHRKVLLLLAAGNGWLFVPFLFQSLSMHGWVYAIHFLPSVVLGWIGFLTSVVPGHRTTIFAPVMLSFIALLIWVIQMRWFLVAYLS